MELKRIQRSKRKKTQNVLIGRKTDKCENRGRIEEMNERIRVGKEREEERDGRKRKKNLGDRQTTDKKEKREK